MASFKYANAVSQRKEPIFDALMGIGHLVSRSGIYRCRCGRETAARAGEHFAADEHRHAPHEGAVRWQLVVQADQ